jgi:hypothetical protein
VCKKPSEGEETFGREIEKPSEGTFHLQIARLAGNQTLTVAENLPGFFCLKFAQIIIYF